MMRYGPTGRPAPLALGLAHAAGASRCARLHLVALFSFGVLFAMAPLRAQSAPAFGAQEAERFVRLALGCIHREYPNKIAHVLDGDEDARPPRALTPIFYGCFDWHSSVHGHWLLARAIKIWPSAPFAAEARAALRRSITQEGVAGEVAYLTRRGREPFERPYGLAWLLQLSAELKTAKDEELRQFGAILQPLEDLAARRFQEWLPKLSHPIRTGEHSQTAFALGLVLDYARGVDHRALIDQVTATAMRFHAGDRGASLKREPSGQDFLSPVLAEADLLRRVLPAESFAAWLGAFLPELPWDPAADFLPVAVVTDPTDGKLAHLDGLNLSRAWMLQGIAHALPAADPRRPALEATAARHAASGLKSVTESHYEGGHWLGSFAVYLVTRRGLSGM